MTMSAPVGRVNFGGAKTNQEALSKILSRKYSSRLLSRRKRYLVPKALQATDKGLGETRGTKPLIIICSEFAKRAVVLEKIVGQDKDLVSDGDDGSLASTFRG